MYLGNHKDVVLCSRTTVLEGDVVLILAIENQPHCPVVHSVDRPLTSKTTLKPLSGDAPQKTHFAMGSRTSVAVDLQHDIVKTKRKTLPLTALGAFWASQSVPHHVFESIYITGLAVH